MRRIRINKSEQVDDVLVASADGMAGEEIESEVYQQYGLSANPTDGGESLLVEINGAPDNTVALPAGGNRIAKEGETLIYYCDTTISLTDDAIEVTVGGNAFNIKDGKIKTDMDIETTGTTKTNRLIVAGRDYQYHGHSDVENGPSSTGGVV